MAVPVAMLVDVMSYCTAKKEKEKGLREQTVSRVKPWQNDEDPNVTATNIREPLEGRRLHYCFLHASLLDGYCLYLTGNDRQACDGGFPFSNNSSLLAR